MDDAIFDCVPVRRNNVCKNNRKTSLNSKVASSLAMRVSWLKFEPRSRISPCKINHFCGSFYYCYSREFFFLFLLDKNVSLKEVVTRNKWKKGNYWYDVLLNGKMAKNTVIDGYKLNANGEWV